MQAFQENNCRLCTKTFCCKDCRASHEEHFHKVNPDCEICIYGRGSVKDASIQLLTHIKAAHWPVHCVFCKKVFTTLDDLIHHNKCPINQIYLKMQSTPKTPVTPITNKEEQSVEITPFYKTLQVGANQNDHGLKTTVMTSTPLVPKDEDQLEKITPINQSQISYPHKSSLKLTDFSSLSDSKKSERRVTFSETPSVSEYSRKPKCLPLNKDMLREEGENYSTDDSDIENFKTAPTELQCEEKENINNEIVNIDRGNSTLWESALTKLDNSNPIEAVNTTNHFNISVQINLLNNTSQTEGSSLEAPRLSNKSISLWSSMSNIVKSVVNNISVTAQNSFSSVSVKRSQSDTDAEVPSLKRIKLTELRCRRPLRTTGPCTIRLIKPRFVDKATQTEESWM